MQKYYEFFKLREAKAVAADYTKDIKAIQSVLKKTKGYLRGADKLNRVIFTTVSKKGDDINNYITTTGQLATIQNSVSISKSPEEVTKYINSFVTDFTPNVEVSILIEKLKDKFPDSSLQGEMAQPNGLWEFQKKNGETFLVKVTKFSYDGIEVEIYNKDGQKEEVEDKNSEKKADSVSNTLSQMDIQKIGYTIIKRTRGFLEKIVKSRLEENPFKIAVQIIGTGRKKESKIQKVKRLTEAGLSSGAAELRVVASFYSKNKKEVITEDKWNAEIAKECLEEAKNNLLSKYSKGIMFIDPETKNLIYRATLTDLSRVEITDEKGLQGYFDLEATKIISSGVNRALSIGKTVGKTIFNKTPGLSSSANAGFKSV